MTWKSVSQVFVDALKKPENKFMRAVIAYNFTAEQETTNHTHASNTDDNSQNILGPAPTTAVAMIILYSITGVVTFLFLTVITVGKLFFFKILFPLLFLFLFLFIPPPSRLSVFQINWLLTSTFCRCFARTPSSGEVRTSARQFWASETDTCSRYCKGYA